MKRIICCIFTAIMVLSCFFSFTSFALNGQKITIEYISTDGPVTNASFSIYRIGDVSGNRIIPNSVFGSYSVSFDISDAEKMLTLAQTVSAYALRDDIVPDLTDTTDRNGIADFDGHVFEDGAYLYIGEKHFQNGNIYFCEPVIVVLPYGDSDSVISKPKYEVVPEDTESISVAYRVLKGWQNDAENNRPPEIRVQLLRDGEIYDTVTLNIDNNWRHQWDNLSARYHWTVTEKDVANGYFVSLSKNEKTFLLVNSVPEEEDTTSPDESTTEPEDTTSPSESTTSTTETTTKPDEPELPQTGALRWPIPYLACVGVFLFIVGFATYRKSELADE